MSCCFIITLFASVDNNFQTRQNLNLVKSGKLRERNTEGKRLEKKERKNVGRRGTKEKINRNKEMDKEGNNSSLRREKRERWMDEKKKINAGVNRDGNKE
jgi:hypothetical protein